MELLEASRLAHCALKVHGRRQSMQRVLLPALAVPCIWAHPLVPVPKTSVVQVEPFLVLLVLLPLEVLEDAVLVHLVLMASLLFCLASQHQLAQSAKLAKARILAL